MTRIHKQQTIRIDATRMWRAHKESLDMKNYKAVVAMIGIALIIAIGAMGARTASAAPPTVGLGTAANFSVLGGTTVTNTGTTIIDRNVGVWSGTAITGTPPAVIGGTSHAGDAVAQQAQSDLTAAYLDAAGRGSTPPTLGDLVGQTIFGGVYTLSSLTSDLTGVVTLDGQSDPSTVWIFKSPSTLITSSTSRVLLTNGANPCNVFWQVGSSAVLGTNSGFVGTILALTSITVPNGVTVEGRALARNGAVTLDNDVFITAPCNAVSVPGPVSALPPCEFMANLPNAPCAGTRIAANTPTPATAAPSAATTAPAAATATPTVATPVTPAATPSPAVAAVAAIQTLPSTSTDDSMNPLILLAVALAGVGVFMLIRKPTWHL